MTGRSEGPTESIDGPWKMDAAGFSRFVRLLLSEFDDVIAPVHEGGAVRLRPITSEVEITTGVVDEQEAGAYRTRVVDSPLRFSHGPGPDSLKALVHPPRRPVWTMRRRDGSLIVESSPPPARSVAVLGARGCDLRALSVLERTQVDGPHPDPDFVARRASLLVVAVDCSHPAPTCFCWPDGQGPSAHEEYDIALTEMPSRDNRFAEYVARSGSQRGAELLAGLDLVAAGATDVDRAEAAIRAAEGAFVREMPPDAATIVLNPDHPHWAEVADRCLTCGNCTAVCPTCFCTDMDDEVSLDGDAATRHRVWDTCFSMEYSALGGAPHRATPTARYRQWLTHKLGTWHEQFGESGCVGCGRCITWCPVGIDLTAEVESLGRIPVESS